MADLLFPLTIEDTSPLISYSPFADTFTAPDTSIGWNPYYTESAFASINSGAGSDITAAIGNGTSLHVTACNGATLQIAWNGTDITAFGTLVRAPLSAAVNLPDTPYTVVLDGTATANFLFNVTPSATLQDAASDFLVSFQGLPDGPHTLQLVFHNPDNTDTAGNATTGIIAFDRFVVDADAGVSNTPPSSSLPATATSSATPSATATTASVPDDVIAFRGQWSFQAGILPNSSATFHTSNNAGDRATLVFNGSAVGLTGLTTPASGAYNVSLDSGIPITLSARASFTSSASTLLFFQAGLDPSIMHSIEVVNVGPAGAGDGAGSLLVLGAVNVTTIESSFAAPTGAAKPSALSRGAIAALAIGVTLGVAALVAAVLYLVRRRRRSARHKRRMLVNPNINRVQRMSFLFPHKRHAGETETAQPEMQQKALDGAYGPGGVLDIRSPTSGAQEKHEHDESDESDGDGEGEGGVDEEHRLSAAEKGKHRATRRSNASKNSDGSYSIELPDLTIAQVPRGYMPTSVVPSTPSPPRTLVPSPTSPRSPARPRGPRDLPGRESTRGILLADLATVPVPAHLYGDSHMLSASSYLPETHISPLRVEFASDVQDRPEGRAERTVSTGAMSLPQSLRQALAQQMASHVPIVATPEPPSPTRPDRAYSFLDFSSSTSTSLSRSQRHSESNSTGKSRSSSRSKRNTGSEQSQAVNWASLPPDRRISLGLSMTLASGGTASRPSLGPHITLHTVPLSQSSSALPGFSADQTPSPDSPEHEGPDQDFPYDANQLPSPTDSVPYTVSDIHFRHSTHSSISMPAESRRTSAYRLSGSHRPPHPPLPHSPGPSSPTRATHRRAADSQGGSQSVTPFIVQRILGRTPGSTPASPFASPTSPQFVSLAAGMRQAPPAGGASPTLPQPPLPVSGGASGSSGQTAAPATPGSSSAVFGFQIGRHR